MKKTTIKKMSVLGLVLMGASAVTAAILPSKSNSDANQLAVTLTQRLTTDGEAYTCQVTEGQGAGDCVIDAATISTGAAQADSTVDQFQTARNTEEAPI